MKKTIRTLKLQEVKKYLMENEIPFDQSLLLPDLKCILKELTRDHPEVCKKVCNYKEVSTVVNQILPEVKKLKKKNRQRSWKKKKNPQREKERKEELVKIREKAKTDYKRVKIVIKEHRKTMSDYKFDKLETLKEYFLLLQDDDLFPLASRTWEKLAKLNGIHPKTIGKWLSNWYKDEDFEEHRGHHSGYLEVFFG